MMRVTNSMIVKRSKTNINANRAQVDYTNNQMASQKKITKPSDNPIIAIRALRLRSTLSTVTQYYENNIPDTESWMSVTETALKNMKSLMTSAYEQVVYGSTDSLNQDNRKTILKELQELQDQVYCEGNSDYAGRTVFTGYKTNQDISFIDSLEASKASYQISERYSYKDIEQKSYYVGSFTDTSNEALLGTVDGEEDVDDTEAAEGPGLFNEVKLNRLRLAYDKISSDKDSALTISIPVETADGKSGTLDAKIGSDGNATVGGINIAFDEDGNLNEDQIALDNGMNGYYAVYDSDVDGYRIYRMDQMDMEDWEPPEVDEDYEPDPDEVIEPEPLYPDLEPKEDEEENYLAIVKIGERENEDGDTVPVLSYQIGKVEESEDGEEGEEQAPTDIVYRVVSSTTELKESGYEIQPNEIVFDAESGELLFHDDMAQLLDAKNTSITMDYEKTGFDLGELKPENYFNCTKHTDDKGDIVYKNYDENWNWNQEAIYYNIAGGQQMRINTEARDVFDSGIRRDMDDLIDIVNFAISAQDTVDEITKKIESGEYSEEEVTKLNQWLDAANKQLDYANQNMHDTYSAYITKFQGYLNTINLEITDIGGRAERVELTKNRMSIQQSTFKELKSANEDMELSDLVINYSAASVAYQAALQSSAKIGQMTLLNYI